MDLERAFELTGMFFSGVLRGVERGVTSLFGSANARQIKRLSGRIDAINNLEPQMKALSDAELRELTDKFRARLRAGETLDNLLVEAFAACREAGRRFRNMRHYDVQLIGGMVLHSGAIAEMVTGEGKTLVATLPAYLNALEGKGVHVVTVNDYLARRDMEWMAPLYMGLGLTVGAIQSNMRVLERQEAYSCDITYGTNNEFGFDYLRDNMRPAARGDARYEKEQQQSQGTLNYAIVDEVDNILIDEARTPLIISGPAHDDIGKYSEADRIARQLKKDVHFTVNEKDHTANLTDEGVRAAEKLAGVESFYTAGNMEWPHLIDNSLKAHHLYRLDVNYVVKRDGEEGERVVIVDEFTGRLMEGRQWSDGLHQAVEAKEGVRIKEETQTLATITLQNFFKLYKKISGMTGTAMTEANEFWKIYKLDVIAIPTNRPLQRKEFPDVIYGTEREKFHAVADEIEQLNKWDAVFLKDGETVLGHIQSEDEFGVTIESQSRTRQTIQKDKVVEIQRKGRPVLVGTVSIEKSERLSKMLEMRGIKHAVLNAKHHEREAEIVAQAGRLGAVTIATNMAGRGTDIILGGNPETMAWARLQHKYKTRLDVPHEEWTSLVHEIEQKEQMKTQGELVKKLGGLHVVGTERHDARRIDLQLRGRTGRQGDPGSSRFYLSLEDDLMRIFAGPWVKTILEKLGMKEGERIESRMVTRRIEAAQKKVEERHFEARKNLLEYDEVMDEQRKRVYRYRQQILDGVNCRDLILESAEQQIDRYVTTFLDRDFGLISFAKYAGHQLHAQLEPRDFRGMDFQQAELYAVEEAERQSETAIFDAIDENLPDGEDESEWNWEALAKFSNTRWGTNLRDRDLRREGREHVSSVLLEHAHTALRKVDLSEGKPYLEPDFGLKSCLGWVAFRFGIGMNIDDVRNLEPEQLKARIRDATRQVYECREIECPVMAGLSRFTDSRGHLDRESLIAWARDRFGEIVSVDDLRHKQREETRDLLVHVSQSTQQKAREAVTAVKEKVQTLFGSAEHGQPARFVASANGQLESLSGWLRETLQCELPAEQMGELDREQLERRLLNAVEDRYHPEMRRLERMVLLQIVDQAWKDHLLAMDHLRSSVGLKGYAQMDPKVEYKREGMRLYDAMWESIGERVTELVFRMEQISDDFMAGSVFRETVARHDEVQSASEIARQQEAAISSSQGEVRIDPIRNRGQKVGRNDPCPCGSGKKYKNCHMRLHGAQ